MMYSKETQNIIEDDFTDLTTSIVKKSERMMGFLHKTDFFDKPFSMDINAHVITDGRKVGDYLYDEISEKYGDFEEILNEAQQVITEYPRTAVCNRMNRLISDNLFANNRNYHDAENEAKKGCSEIIDNMDYLLTIIFYFYVLELELPEFIETIFAILENNGLPCGWVGDYPKGKMVVFSNG